MSGGATPWYPQSLAFSRSVTAVTTLATQPTGFAQGGNNYRVINSGALPILIVFYNFTLGTPNVNTPGTNPTLVFPVDGNPPVGQVGVVIPAGADEIIQGVANADSFAAIGQAAGPTLIFVQRGEGI